MVPSFIGPRCSPHRCVQCVPSDAEVVGSRWHCPIYYGAKRVLGNLLNILNGTVALPTHWHLRDEIIVARTDVGRMGGTDVGRMGGGGVIEHLPAPAIPRSLLLLGKHCDCLSRALASHYSSNRHDCARAVAGTGEVMCFEGGMQVSNLR